MRKRLTRPSGHPPPEALTLPGGELVSLIEVAAEVTENFLKRFPDEFDRYEDPAVVREWCSHDVRHLIGWAAAEAEYDDPLARQLDWLGVVLESRGYPVHRLADSLDIAADVLRTRLGHRAEALCAALAGGAGHVRSTPTFLVDRRP